jgi:hypothetical protein
VRVVKFKWEETVVAVMERSLFDNVEYWSKLRESSKLGRKLRVVNDDLRDRGVDKRVTSRCFFQMEVAEGRRITLGVNVIIHKISLNQTRLVMMTYRKKQI